MSPPEPTLRTRAHSTLALLVLALIISACSGGGSDDTANPTFVSTPPTTTDLQTTTSGQPISTESPSTSTSEPAELPEEIDRPDLLTFAQGAIFVSQTGLPSGGSQSAMEAIDGNPGVRGVTSDDNGAVTYVYKLPANTVFDRIAVPNVMEAPGNATFIKDVIVEGSVEGPDSGYVELVSLHLDTHGPDEEFTETTPQPIPVRWVRVTLEGGINIEPGDEGRTNLQFSEIIGNGTQDPVPLSNAFNGIWDNRGTERLDLSGDPLELHQDGTTIAGCLDTVLISGTVNGNIARASGIDAKNGHLSALIFVSDDDGTVYSVISVNQGSFKPNTAVEDPDLTTTPCSDEVPEPQVCDSIVYINFDVDSSVIKPESNHVLDDLYQRLVEQGISDVSIEGHTSTEGSDVYNQGLSERRAEAVVVELVTRGYDSSAISALGAGESMPLVSPDDNESARSLNRRVEVLCG